MVETMEQEVEVLDSGLFSDQEEMGGFISRNQQGLVWGSIGLTAGLTAGFGAWFYERRKRIQALETLTFGIAAAVAVYEGGVDVTSVASEKGKIVDINAAEYVMNNLADLQRVIEEKLVSVKLGQKEFVRWVGALRSLAYVANLIQAKHHNAQNEKMDS